MIVFSIFWSTIHLKLLHITDINNHHHHLQGRFKKQILKKKMLQN